MTDTAFSLSADTNLDDLPRTLRREHEARAREARRREMSGATDAYPTRDESYSAPVMEAPPPATVTRINVPFFRLAAFFIKAVLAAIPALILLTVILWLGGQALQAFYPELLHMKILITFPNS
jgi:hypothetical protein